MLKTYKEAFPDKPVFLNLSHVITRIKEIKEEGLQEKIVEEAVNIFGNHLYLQQNGLHEKTETEGLTISHKLMKKYSDKCVIGFQTMTPENHGDLGLTIKKGLAYPISYIEIFTVDLKDKKNQKDLKYLFEELQKRR